MTAETRLDLFCRVIDNYGDIGVCWRLARQLAAEHGFRVRLLVDDLGAFRFLAPQIDPDLAAQSLLGVEVLQWQLAETLSPAEVVIEAFACDPPAAYVAAMALQQPKPVWLNLEYLSAEAWVDGVHGRPSPHPRLPLVKYFFCPGFTELSGGLIREAGVAGWSAGNAAADTDFAEARREVDGAAPHPPPGLPLEGGGTESDSASGRSKGSLPVKGRVRRGMGFPNPASPTQATGNREVTLFAFTYPDAPVAAVARALMQAGHTVAVASAARLAHPPAGATTLAPVPQPAFDELLAGFDVLLVRGEDSFVRAQWAAKPMLWHIYPTDDGAHRVKLDAWLDRYCEGLAEPAAAALRAASHAFIRGDDDPAAYAAWSSQLPALALHARAWRARLLRQTDLATRLVRFIALVKSQNVG